MRERRPGAARTGAGAGFASRPPPAPVGGAAAAAAPYRAQRADLAGAALVVAGGAVAVFAGGLSRWAVDVTVIDDALTRRSRTACFACSGQGWSGLAGTGRDNECMAQMFPECSPAEGGCHDTTSQSAPNQAAWMHDRLPVPQEKHPEGAVRARAAARPARRRGS
jgi:hypothetical protein